MSQVGTTLMDHYMSRTPHFVSLGFCWNFIPVSLLPLPVLVLVAQVYLTLCCSIDCCLPGSSVHWDSPGKNTGVCCQTLLQGIFPTQGSSPGLPHSRQILYCLSHQGSPAHGCQIAKSLLFTEVHMGKCFGSYYVCACVCALVEDDL